MPGCKIETMGFDPKKLDHVHVVMVIPPEITTSHVMATLKAQSATVLADTLLRSFLERKHSRDLGYFVSSIIGLDKAIIKHYVVEYQQADSDQLRLSIPTIR